MNREVVIRLDDVRGLCDRLERVWTVLEDHGAPVHLGVIPADLTADEAGRLLERAARSRTPVSAQQHGYLHLDRGTGKRRFEFGDERGVEEQRSDVLAGRRILERRLGSLFEPIFVPPWDRLGESTLEVLADEQYLAVSVIETSSSPESPRVPRVPMTTDPVKWRPQPVHKPWDATFEEVEALLADRGYAGIELHHEIMDEAAAAGLEGLLGRLAGVEWPTMRSVAERLRGGGGGAGAAMEPGSGG